MWLYKKIEFNTEREAVKQYRIFNVPVLEVYIRNLESKKLHYSILLYVCTTQLGMEALICGKEVHTFGIPFYSGWGLTIDYQDCERRTNKRSIEELFYIAYIMYSHYVNPDKKSGCEIEEAMDYLLRLRDEYFSKHNN